MSRTRISLLALVALLVVVAASPGRAQPSGATNHRTALQSHVDFFDRDGDGLIRVDESVEGLYALGLPRLVAYPVAYAIHLGLPKTRVDNAWYRSLTIDTARIHLGKHGSDTGAYDEQGNFVHPKFVAIFQYDLDQNDAIDEDELKAFHEGYATDDGLSASKAEFGLLMFIAGNLNTDTGLKELDRATLEALYDGTLFYKLEQEVAAARLARREAAEKKRGLIDRLRGW